MARIKGSGLGIIRKLIKAKGPEFEQTYIDKLSPLDREKYLYLQPIQWWSFSDGPGFLRVAAEMLYPSTLNPFKQLANQMAKAGLTGIYKIFMQIPSREFIIKRVAKVWRTYQDTGYAVTENIQDKKCDFVVRDFPDMPDWFREYMCGYLQGVFELTGAKDVKVLKLNNDVNVWRWRIMWK